MEWVPPSSRAANCRAGKEKCEKQGATGERGAPETHHRYSMAFDNPATGRGSEGNPGIAGRNVER